MKRLFSLVICLCLLLTVSAVYAQDGGFKVTYLENECLASVPVDENTYEAGQTVEVLFDPVSYKDYLIFYGWDIDNDGAADFGYNYKTFEMPEADVELKAICISAFSAPAAPCRGKCRPVDFRPERPNWHNF